MMKEQGNQFDWSQIAIDIPSLPCFKPEAEWPWGKIKVRNAVLDDVLAEGYAAFSGFIVRVTGENPTVTVTPQRVPTFVDCEPVVITEYAINPSGGPISFNDLTNTNIKPIRYIALNSGNYISRLEESYSVADINIPMESAVVTIGIYPSEDRTTARELVVIADGGSHN